MVGNTDAIESPNVQAATHSTRIEDGHSSNAPTLRNMPVKSAIRIVRGRNLAAIGIASKRPNVNNNKNTEFNLYAAILSPSPVFIV